MGNTDLTRLHCRTCGVEFGILKVLYESLQENGGFYHCSNGHGWGWKDDASARAQKERDQQRLAQKVAQLNDEVAAKERELSAAKGRMTKLRKRVGNGVCPCCTRSFTNLARHMKTKHPEVSKPRLAEAV